MNRKALAAVLVVPLLAAVIYASWPASPVAPQVEPSQQPVATPALPISGEGRGERRTQPGSTAPRDVQPLAASKPQNVAPVPTTPPQLAAPSPASRDLAPTGADALATPAPKSPPHTLDREGIRSAIREKLPEMQDCYDSWLQQNPELGGTVALSFQVIAADGGGVVQNIAIVDGGVGHRAFEGCVGNVFNDLDFEEPMGGTMNVTYPVMFSNNPPP